MVLDPIPQSLPVHLFGSRPQSPTSRTRPAHISDVGSDVAKKSRASMRTRSLNIDNTYFQVKLDEGIFFDKRIVCVNAPV